MGTIVEKLENVTVMTKANVYFEGGVISHTVITNTGERKTLGLIRPGAYNFSTDAPEKMEIVAGQCRVCLAQQPSWTVYHAGDAFHIPGNSAFDIMVEDGLVEYVCSYE